LKIFCTDQFTFPLPESHTFPIGKYALLRQRVVAAALVRPEDLRVPHAASDKELLRAHDEDYLRPILHGELTQQEIRRIGFPWSAELVERARRSSGATIEACRAALQEGVGINLAGGTHHAFRDHGEGFCYINDIAVAIKKMQNEKKIERAAIIDCDLHQGNGTAKIFQGDASVYTFSIHQEHLYPIKEESNLDIGLDDFASDATYLHYLRSAVPKILTEHKPQLVVFVAGADPYKDDQLGTLQLTKEGLDERDSIVIDGCRKENIPFAVVFAGGYALKIQDTVDIHVNTCRLYLGITEPVVTTENQAESTLGEKKNKVKQEDSRLSD